MEDPIFDRNFHIVSAGLLNFLPEIPPSLHADIYRNILHCRRLSQLEQNNLSLLETIKTVFHSAGEKESFQSRNRIFCTFHIGSYRILNLWLVSRKIPVTLVAGERVIREQGQALVEMAGRIHPSGTEPALSIINAESPGAGFRMLKDLKSGRSLVTYMDGNTGTGQRTSHNENCCELEFLGQSLYARTGIPFLSHATGVPVTPVICTRQGADGLTLDFHESIQPAPDLDRKDFSETITRKLYQLAAAYIRRDPGQWEGWLYLHKSAKLSRPLQTGKNSTGIHPGQPLRFNLTHYGLFPTSSNKYIFNKLNYISYPVPDALFETLQRSVKGSIQPGEIATLTLTELLKHQVLVFT